MTNKFLFSLVLLLALTSSVFSAPPAKVSSQELISKNIEAMGGAKRIAAMDNLKVIFDANSSMLKGEITLWLQNGTNYRMDVNQGKQYPINSIVITPSIGFGHNPQGTIDTIKGQALEQYQLTFNYQASMFKSPLYGYDPSNSVVEYVGRENKNGVKYYVLEMAPIENPAQKSKIYLDPDKYFVNYIISETPNGDVVVELSNYKKSASIAYPTKIQSSYAGQVQNVFELKSLEIAPQFPKGLFTEIK